MKKRSWLLIWTCAALALALTAGCIGWYFVDQQQACMRFGLRIEPVYQFDYDEPVCSIGGEPKSVATSGCGATCMSMVIGYLTGNTAQTPETLFAEAYACGDYGGYGLSHDALGRMAAAYGIDFVWLERSRTGHLRAALENGYPVIAHMGPGKFTDEGHYILLRGLTDDGRVVLNDPNSRLHSVTTHDLAQIIAESKTAAPFMVCRLMGE